MDVGTFLSDYLSSAGIFGDYIETIYHTDEYVETYGGLKNEEITRWGARHGWYFLCMFLLFMLQLISLIWYIVDRIKTLIEDTTKY